MAEENFVHKTLDKLLDVIEVELKLPLGIAEVKMSPTAIAKEWRENERKRSDLENAIQRAEEKFVADHKDQKVAQMLHEFPLYSDDEFKEVIANLLTHLSEEKIAWLAEVKLTKTWGNIVSANEIRNTLELYLPYLRDELNSIRDFREIISAFTIKRIESKLDKLIESQIVLKKKQEKRIAKPIKNASVEKYDEEIPNTITVLNEGRILQIVVSQMFRLADLLTYPEGLKAKRFYEVITDSTKYRRLLNRKQGFEVKPYGILKPTTTINDQFDTFWKKAIPNLRKDVDPLRFIPFELDLSQHLKTLDPDPGSILESAIKGKLDEIQNIQIGGNLRIYPPGTGIIRMSITLEFKVGIHLELSAELARNIESLLFVDPNNPSLDGRPCESIFLEIIDKVAETFFQDEMFVGAERRWQPPETMFNFRDFHGNMLDDKVETLARLMSYAPANYEKLKPLEQRILKALRYSHWQNERVFAVAGQGVALVIIPISDAVGKRESQKKLMNAFVNTRELITAASYATKSFAERIDEIRREQRLDTDRAMDDEKIVKELHSILFTMKRVMLAVSSIQEHLHNLGRGELMTFAKDLWIYDNPVDLAVVHEGLDYIMGKLSANKSNNPNILELQKIIPQIIQLPSPFPARRKEILFKN